MRILGIDPGTATIGFGVVERDEAKEREWRMCDFGVIKTEKILSTADRLNIIANDLKKLCHQWKPDACAVEEIFFSKNVKTAIKVAQARGVILQTIQTCGRSIFEYNPLEIKMAVTGDGGADKRQIQKMVTLLLRLKIIPRPDDAADALAVALCHAQHVQFQHAVIGVKPDITHSTTPPGGGQARSR